MNRFGSWAADRWRREVAKTLPPRVTIAALRAERRLRVRYLLALAVDAALVVAVLALRRPEITFMLPWILLGLNTLVTPALLATAIRLNVEFTDRYLEETWRALAGFLEAEIATGATVISTRTLGRDRAVAVTRRAGPNLVVAVYPWRREVWVAVGEYELPRVSPSAALPLMKCALRGEYLLLPGRLFRRGQPAWIVLTIAPTRRLVGRRRRTAQLARWETTTEQTRVGETTATKI